MSATAATPSTWTPKLGVFDLETTGIDPTTARVVTAFVGVVNADGTLESGREWIVDPGIEIPAAAAQVHGVTTERAQREGRAPGEAIAEIQDALTALLSAGTGVVAFNAAYDFSVLHADAIRNGIAPLVAPSPVVDPLVLDKQVDRFRKGKRTLGVMSAHYGVVLDGWHDASADAVAAGRIAFALADRYPEVRIDLGELHARTETWAAAQEASFGDYMQRQGRPFTPRPGWPVKDAVR